PRRGRAGQPEPEPEPEDAADSPGFFEVAIGFAAHSLYGARAALKRVFKRGKPDQTLPARTWQGTDFEPQLDRSIPLARHPERSEPPFSREFDDTPFDDDEDDEYTPAARDTDDDIARLSVEQAP